MKKIVFFYLLILINNPLFAQIAGQDIYICEGQETQLNASILNDFFWSPANFLNDPYSPNPTVSGLLQTTDFVLTTNYQNQIVNGDFEMGNTAFITDYTVPLFPGPYGLLSNESTYAITNNANSVHLNFLGNDHTNPPIGNFMVVNGSNVLNTKVWCQNITLQQNTVYEFSTWVSSVVAENLAVLEFSINNVSIGQPFTAPAQVNVWNEYYALWNSGMNTSAEICIVNLNSGASGNDFGIDDISFNIYNQTDTVTVFVNEQDSVVHKVTLCEDINGSGINSFDLSNINSNLLFQSNAGLDWYLDEQYQLELNQNTISATNNLTLHATENNNKCKKARIDFEVHSTPKISIISEDSICLGESYNFSDLNLFFQTFDSIQSLKFTSNGTILPMTNYSPTTSQNINIVCQTEYGCKDSSELLLKVNPIPFIDAGSPQFYCSKSGFLRAYSSNDINYLWKGDNSMYIHNIYDTKSKVTIEEFGTYQFILEATNLSGCKNQANTSIEFVEKPDYFNANYHIDINPVYEGEIFHLINTSTENTTAFWDFGNGMTSTTHSKTMSYDTSGHYTVKLIIENYAGCTDSISKNIIVHPFIKIYIPKSFTPNNDDINDIFEVYGNGIANYNMIIFNRWGEIIYSNTNQGWDGKFKNNEAQDGIYTYKVMVEDFKRKQHYLSGEVSLIR
jgi:gliding motility-associated-like protein